MSTLSLGLLALALIQDPTASDPAPRVEIVGGVVGRDGKLDLTRLGLGDGGLSTDRFDPRAEGVGRFRTTGGVLIRALTEGVKIDFPSGGELLIDPRGRIHLRDGSRTLPAFSGVRIRLLDGAIVDALPQNGADLALREVRVHDGGESSVLWRAGRRVSRRERGSAFHGRTLHALGDGRALYEVADVGVSIVFERVLCPRELHGELPPRAVFVVGDVLARSLVEISQFARQRASGDPRTQQIASAMASTAPYMFGPGRVHARPAGARGDLVIPLDGGFRMKLDVRSSGPVVLSMLARGDDIPLCEWTTTNVTRLHLVQHDAREDGGPRYLMRGYALREMLDPLLGFEPGAPARARARRALVELAEAVPGGGQLLPVERRDADR